MVIDKIDDSEVLALYRSGHSTRQIAAYYGVCRQTICTKLKKLGAIRPKKESGEYILATYENLEKYCRPPGGCLSCPFSDCKAYNRYYKNKFARQTKEESSWLKTAGKTTV